MKTIKELNIKDWIFFFKAMINILDIDPGCFMINDIKQCTDGTLLYNSCYYDKIGVPQIVFNNIDCHLKKSDGNSSHSDYNF